MAAAREAAARTGSREKDNLVAQVVEGAAAMVNVARAHADARAGPGRCRLGVPDDALRNGSAPVPGAACVWSARRRLRAHRRAVPAVVPLLNATGWAARCRTRPALRAAAPTRRQGRMAVQVRTATAGATHRFAAHLAALGVQFSVAVSRSNLAYSALHPPLSGTSSPPTGWPGSSMNSCRRNGKVGVGRYGSSRDRTVGA